MNRPVRSTQSGASSNEGRSRTQNDQTHRKMLGQHPMT
jgi:hypothetical protein